MFSGDRLRRMTVAFGIGTVGFSVVPLLFPRAFASWFGIPLPSGPAGDVLIRSISSRDLVSGVGILSAVMHGGRVAPWLLGRTLIDASDTVTIGFAAATSARHPRFLTLGGVALLATLLDLALYLSHKAAARRGYAGRSATPLG